MTDARINDLLLGPRLAVAMQERPEVVLPVLREILRARIGTMRAARLGDDPAVFATDVYSRLAGFPEELAGRACLDDSDAELFEAMFWRATRDAVVNVETARFSFLASLQAPAPTTAELFV